jgi:hypothetical protein
MLVGAGAVVLRCVTVRWDRPPLTLTLSPSGERGPFYRVRAWLRLLRPALSDGFEAWLRLLLPALSDGFEAWLRLLCPAISDGFEAWLRLDGGGAELGALEHGLKAGWRWR